MANGELLVSAAIEPLAIYTVRQAAPLVCMHPKTLLRKIRRGVIRARGYQPRILGSELIRLATPSLR